MILPSNSQECAYEGYKLSSILTNIAHSPNVCQVVIGCEDDDEFYKGAKKAGRVQIMVELNTGEFIFLDLEHLLKFSAIYCKGIYKRQKE